MTDLSDQKSSECVRVRGARVHNLKNIDVNIPRDGLRPAIGSSIWVQKQATLEGK